MNKQFAQGFIDIQIGDLIEVEGEIGEIWDMRFVQELRHHQSYFECKLEHGNWIPAATVKVVRRNIKSG